ncbi:LexA family protein [Streptomyces sp. NPDC055092]
MSTIAPYALTERQRRIVACAREWIAEHGEAPSVRELGAAVGLTSTSSVAYHLRRLRERGLTVQTRGRRSDRCPHCGQ